MIHFITGNKGKFEEAKAILDGEIEQLDIDLPEIQELDPHKIIEAKLKAAFEHHSGEMIVEDGGVYLEALGGFPGPLIKWYWQALGPQKIFEVCEKLGNNMARIQVIIGYSKGQDIKYFEGEMTGKVVAPTGAEGFGWDVVFVPDGYDKTFAEMDVSVKNSISHRRQALDKLKEYLAK